MKLLVALRTKDGMGPEVHIIVECSGNDEYTFEDWCREVVGESYIINKGVFYAINPGGYAITTIKQEH